MGSFEYLKLLKSSFSTKSYQNLVFRRRLFESFNILKWILQYVFWKKGRFRLYSLVRSVTNQRSYMGSYEYLKFLKSYFSRKYDENQLFQRRLLPIFVICKWILQFLVRSERLFAARGRNLRPAANFGLWPQIGYLVTQKCCGL